MKCLILFSGKSKKNISLSPAEDAQRVVKAKLADHIFPNQHDRSLQGRNVWVHWPL